MQPSRTLLNRMVDLWLGNTLVFTVADPNQIKVAAVNVPFVAGLDRVIGDVPAQGVPLNPASLPVLTDAASYVYSDPLTDERVARLPFNGGLNVFRADAGSFPFTIYGVRLTDASGATLIATETLAVPVTYAKTSDGTRSPGIEFRFPPTMIR